MTRGMISLACMGLFMGGAAIAQQGSPTPTNKPEKPTSVPQGRRPAHNLSLEDMLTKALQNNPDIRVAQAKLSEAEANLEQVRLQVAQKVVQLHKDLESSRAAVKTAEARFERMKRLSSDGRVPATVLDDAEAALINAKAHLAKLETQAPYLTGTPSLPGLGIRVRSADLRTLGTESPPHAVVDFIDPIASVSALPADLKKALEAPAGGTFQNTALHDVLAHLADMRGFSVVYRGQTAGVRINLTLEEKTRLAAVLEAIEDTQPVRFLIRDYGILVVDAADVPPGAPTLREYGKKERSQKREDRKKQ